MASANSLIETELPLNYSTTPHPSLPTARDIKYSGLVEAEHTRLSSGVPRADDVGIDLTRYAPPEPPSPTASKETWTTALQQAYTSAEYLSARSVNLSLLETYGRNAWLVGNSQLENELKGLEADVERAKLEQEAVEQARRAVQGNAEGEIRGLEEGWRSGVGRMIEVLAAGERVKGEILEKRRRVTQASHIRGTSTPSSFPSNIDPAPAFIAAQLSPEQRKDKQPPSSTERSLVMTGVHLFLHKTVSKKWRNSGRVSSAILPQRSNINSSDRGHWTHKLSTATRSSGYGATCVGGTDDIEMVGQKRREDMAEKDRMALLSSLNSARGLQGCVRLEYDPLLFNGMLGHLSTTEDILEGGDVTKNLDMHVRHLQPTILTAIPVGATEGQRGVMIVSPPGYGGVACGELWAGGKYRAHAYPPKPMRRAADSSGGEEHPEWCPCHLREVWECLVESRWRKVKVEFSGERWTVLLSDGRASESSGGRAVEGGAPGLGRGPSVLKKDQLKRKPLPSAPGEGRVDEEREESEEHLGILPLPARVTSVTSTKRSSWETVGSTGTAQDEVRPPLPLSVQGRFNYLRQLGACE
ncbi:hypothetical protein LTR33_013988 [Friedmanniomyces endolithicus]|nr:hypothetical protein LTR33_013988 [Friedmanniomyces endolithicus]